MMHRKTIEARLLMHIMSLCLAAIAKEEGAVTACKDALIDEVERIVRLAQWSGDKTASPTSKE